MVYHGQSIVTVCWIAPWVLQGVERAQYFEFDASFEALSPYCYSVPTAVVHNYGIPLGLVITPTERTASYNLFWEVLGISDRTLRSQVYAKPLLSDGGSALRSYGERHAHHFFCYRHLLESLGSKTYIAILARRLLFTGSREHYFQLKQEVRIVFEEAIRANRVLPRAAALFSETFGFVIHDDQSISVMENDPFEAQALWGQRGQLGVASSTNHVEGLHGRLNLACTNIRVLSRKAKLIIDILHKKARHFTNNSLRSPKRQLMQMKKVADREGYDQDECDCGWSDIYAHRFGLHDFPCVHTCRNRTVSFIAPPLALSLEADPSIECQQYEGPPWPLPTSKGGCWNTQVMEDGEQDDASTQDNLELKSEAVEEEGCEIDSDVESYIRMLIHELKHALGGLGPNLKLGNIAYEFGIFTVRDQSPNAPDFRDMRTRARFELQFFGANDVI
jgi:hypothetical protein